MTDTASSRFTAAIAGAMLTIGILTGGAAAAQNRTEHLADYGAATTAEDASNAARDKGVPHMSDRHRGSGDFFERMNGAGN